MKFFFFIYCLPESRTQVCTQTDNTQSGEKISLQITNTSRAKLRSRHTRAQVHQNAETKRNSHARVFVLQGKRTCVSDARTHTTQTHTHKTPHAPPTVRTISPPKMQTQIATSCERTMLESKRTREACKQANCSKKVSRVFSKFGEGTSLGTPCQVPNRRQPNSILHLSRLVNSHTHHRAEKRRPQHKNQIHIKKIDRVPIKSPPEIKL